MSSPKFSFLPSRRSQRPYGFSLGGLGGAAAVLLGLVVALTARAQAQTVTMTSTGGKSGVESESTQVTATYNASGRNHSYQWGIEDGTANCNQNGPDYALGPTQSERLVCRSRYGFVGSTNTEAAIGHSIWLNIHDDSLDEPDETIEIGIWIKALNGGSGHFTYTITDNDPTIVSLARVGSTTAINEGDTVEFTVTLGRALVAGETIDVPLSISGTGVTTGDWSLAKKSGGSLNTGVTLRDVGTATPKVRFSGAGAQTATLELTATEDGAADSGESYSIALGADSAFDATSLGTNVGGGADPHSTNNAFSVTVNDVYTLSIGLGGSSVAEGDSGENRDTVINYRLSTGRSAQFPFLACVDTASSTATHRAASGGKAADFNLIRFFSPYASVNLNADGGKCHLYTYPANSKNQNFRLSVFGDRTAEGNETAVVTIKRAPGTPSDVVLGTSSATLTITNDDGTPPVITISSGSAVTEGTGASFTVNANSAPSGNLTVQLNVSDDDTSDFVASGNEGAKTVTIPANQTSATYTVATVNDTVDEANGELTVKVIASEGYTIGSAGAATVQVTDDDTGFCDRTLQVRDAIVAKVAGISNCGDVTATHLAAITGTLNLTSRGMTSLKLGDFDGLTGLEELDLYSNRLRTLPAGIFDELTALTTLFLSDNHLTTLPAGVFDGLTALNSLYLTTNRLRTLPAGIFDELTALESLNVAVNYLTTLPAGVFDNNTALENLRLVRNRLTTLPAGVFDNLTALEHLTLSDNRLTTLPAGVFDNLTALEDLSLSANRLTMLPAGIFDNNTALEALFMRVNRLTTLPENIFAELTALRNLTLDSNPGAPFSPVTNAGSDQTVTSGAVVSLSGAVTGLWGDNVDWEWVQVDGANSNTVVTDGVTLTGATDATASFTAPSRAATLHFRLTTRWPGSSRGTASGVDWVTVTAAPSVGFASGSHSVTEGGSVSVTVTIDPPQDTATKVDLTWSDPRKNAGTTAHGYGYFFHPVLGELGRDFVQSPLRVTVPAGSTSHTFTVRTLDERPEVAASQNRVVKDIVREPDETFTITISEAPDRFARGDNPVTTVTVKDNDGGPDTDTDTAPRVTSIVRYVPSFSPTAANSLTWRVQFSEDVRNVDAADFTITGTTANLSTSQAGNSSLYSVVASGGDLDNLDGTVTLSFANNQNIEDTSGNRLANTAPTGTNHNTFVVTNTVSPPTPVTPVVTISAGTSPVTEGTAASFTMTATPAPSTRLTVDVTASQIGEFADLSFLSSLNGQGVDILVGETSYTFTVPTENDSVDETDGSVTVTVNAGSGYTVGSGATATVAVNDDDDIPDTTAPDVDSITRQAPSSSPTDADSLTWRVMFNEAVRNVDATDFQLSGTTAGLAVAPVTGINAYDVTASGGDLANLDATVALSFVSGQDIEDTSGNRLSDTTPTGINNNTFRVINSQVTVKFSDTGDSVDQGDEYFWYGVSEGDGVTVGVTLSRSRSTATAVTIAMVPLTATGYEVDFHNDLLTITVPAGQTSATGTVRTVEDAVAETDEVFRMDISNLPNGVTAVAPRISYVTIEDDDTAAVKVNPTSVSVSEASGAGRTQTYTVVLATPPPNDEDVTITPTSSDSGAATVSPASLTFDNDSWNRPQTITVTAVDDEVDQSGNRSVTISHSASSDNLHYNGDNISIPSVTVTVVDNTSPPPPPPAPSAVPTVPVVSITGGDEVMEGTRARFIVTANPAPHADLTVTVAVTQSGDYAASGETGTREVTIPTGGSTSFDVATADDDMDEADGSVTATLAAGDGYAVATSPDNSASVTVRDDELAKLSVPSLTVAAGESASYAVTLADQPMGEVTVTIAVTPEQVISLGRSASNTVENAMGLVVTPSRRLFTRSNWNVPQEVVVRVAEDAHGASLVLRHIVSGDGLDGRGDTHLPVTVEARATEAPTETVEAATDAAEGMEAWRLRFGRTLSHQVADALQDRLSPPLPLQPGSRLTVAGEAVSSPPALAENDRVLSKALGFENVSPQLLAEGSSFSFAPQGEAGAPQLALWGQGAFSSFSGQEEEVSLDGDVTTLLVGADWSTGRWQAGAALSRSWGSGSYDGNDDADGEISTTLTGLFPYGRYALSPRLNLWATAGYGWGDLSLSPDGNGEEYEPDTTMTMVALGMDGLLLDGGSEGVSLTTTADLLSLNTTSDEVEGLESSEGKISRFRLGLEATRPFPLANGSSFLPTMEMGIRQDGGDAETGFGMDLGAGIAWKDPQRGISGELKGRTLLSHAEEDFQDQGLALSFSWDPSPSNRGPYLSMGHAMGATATADMDALFNPATFEQTDGNASSRQQFAAELAYGFPVHNDRLTLTPAVAMALSPTSRNYGLLWSLAPYTEQLETDPWQFSIEAERQEHSSLSTPTDHSLKLRFSSLF